MKELAFPVSLTSEEEELKQKFQQLRNKKKQLSALKAPKPKEEKETNQKAVKRQASENAEDAMEHAKKLVMAGKIKFEPEVRNREFKRSKHLEKKLKDPEKGSAPMAFQPYEATQAAEEQEEARDRKPKMKDLYESFVPSGGSRRSFDRDGGRRDLDREPPRRGNTIYVHGHGINEEMLRKAFSNFGTIINISMEQEKNCGFVTFDTPDNADQAISATNGSTVEGIQVRVSVARRQPSFDNIQDNSPLAWGTIAASTSQKGSGHKDKRNMVEYSESDDIF